MLLTFSTALFAIPYHVGNYTVDVEVRNSAMNLVVDAKVHCYLNGNSSITIKAGATGYYDAKKKITLHENQFFYKVDIELRDLATRIYIVDINKEPIQSAYARTDQYGFPGNQFGMKIFIPVVDWQYANEKNVDVIEPFWGLPFKKTCEIRKVDEFYEVSIGIPREALEWSGGELIVVFKTGSPVNMAVLEDRICKLARINPKNEELRYRVSEFIAKSYSLHDLRAKYSELPQPLEAMTAQREKFNKLHRENL
ncbi:MAG: hypothetical protein Kow0029_32150 [Candidatus Rifleibacteriota bacterium]